MVKPENQQIVSLYLGAFVTNLCFGYRFIFSIREETS